MNFLYLKKYLKEYRNDVYIKKNSQKLQNNM